MSMISMVVGATTDDGATFVAKVDTGPVRVAVSTSSDMSSPTFTSSQAVDAQGVAKVSIAGLDPDTRYFWQVEDNSTLDTGTTGRFRTHPTEGEQASFTIAVAACAGANGTGADGGELAQDRISNHEVFDAIRQRAINENWLGFVHLGDLHYYDLGSGNHGISGGGSLANYRTAFDDIMLQPRQHQLYREAAWWYVWDDHDYGPNNSDGTLTDKANAAQVYRERVPHYTLDDASGIWQSWQIGRVQFVASDVRYYRSPNTDTDDASKTMLGQDQKDWLENLLSTSTAEVLVWLMPTPWISGESNNDSWNGFSTERDEIAAILDAQGWLDRMVMVFGDRHALGIDSGASNEWGGFPTLQAASLDSSNTEAATGRFDVLDDTPGSNQYGTVTVTDLGWIIGVRLSAWEGTSEVGTWDTLFLTGDTQEATQDVTVELFYNSVWNDHTADVDMGRGDIRITQGATDAYSHAQPASCQLTFDNRDGKFHTKNPTSSLYGLIGRNTPIRISVAGGIRFSGEVASWTPRRGGKKDAWTNVVANGISRRLGQGSTPLKSSLATEIPTRADTGELHAYWPCEDGAGATQVAAGLPDVEPLNISGDVDPAATTPLPATEALPRLNDGSLSGPAPSGGSRSVILFQFPDAGLTNDGLVCRVVMGGGDIAYAEMRYLSTGGGNLEVTLVQNDDAGTSDTEDSTSVGLGLDGSLWIITFSVVNTSLNPDDSFAVGTVQPVASDGSVGSSVPFNSAFIANTDAGTIRHVTYGGDLGGGIIGHPAIVSTGINDFPYDNDGTLTAYLGEVAGDRVERLCDQEGVAAGINGTVSDTQAMGTQDINTLLTLLRECETADSGILHDAVAQLGFTLRTGRSLYNQDAVVTLDWDSGEIAEPLEPVTDDHDVRNDVTVRRPSGSSARVFRESGALSIQDPPDGVGRYDTSDEVNIVSDGFLENQAGWRLHLGTVDEIRFPRVSIDLGHSADLVARMNPLRPGDRLDLTNLPPEHVAVEEASLLILGWTERVGIHKRKITFNCTPERPYRVAEVGGGAVLGTVGSSAATLAEDLDATETGVDITCGAGPDWVVEAGLFLPGTSGDFVSTPDSASLDITGDIDVRAELTLGDWTSGSFRAIVAKYESTGDELSWRLAVQSDGDLQASWSTDGTFTGDSHTSTVPVPVSSGRLAVRWTLDVDDGGDHTSTFYTAPTLAGPWTQLGSTVTDTGTTSINAGAADLTVGAGGDAGDGNPLDGTIHAVELRDGIGGTVVADPDFTAETSGTTSFDDDSGRVWTVNGDAVIRPQYDIVIGGERMTVTAAGAVSGTFPARTQTLTVTRSVNGVIKTHTSGAAIGMAEPSYIGL